MATQDIKVYYRSLINISCLIDEREALHSGGTIFQDFGGVISYCTRLCVTPPKKSSVNSVLEIPKVYTGC